MPCGHAHFCSACADTVSSVQYEYFYSAIKQDVALRPPEAILNSIRRLKFTPETVVSNVFVAQVCWEAVPDMWPGTAKLLSPNVLCVHRTAHNLSVDERSRRLGPSETKCMSSIKYGGALPDNDEKTKHASLKSTCLWTGSQCN